MANWRYDLHTGTQIKRGQLRIIDFRRQRQREISAGLGIIHVSYHTVLWFELAVPLK
jgi:hypothetical protein